MQFESVRQRKLADQIKKLISQIVDRKLKDPRKGMITITHVKVSGDLRIASVYFSAYGDAEQIENSKIALESANTFIRNEMAAQLSLRYTPELRFFYDDSREYSAKIEQLLDQIKSVSPPTDGENGADDSEK